MNKQIQNRLMHRNIKKAITYHSKSNIQKINNMILKKWEDKQCHLCNKKQDSIQMLELEKLKEKNLKDLKVL